MAEAAELLESPDNFAGNAAGAVPNADELLSQLAGQEIDRMLAEAGDVPDDPVAAEPSAQAEVDPPAADDPFAAQVDELFKELNATPLNPKPEEQVASEIEKALEAASFEQPTTEAERAELDTPATVATHEAITPISAPEEAAPIYLRILEVINAPLANCPESLRDALGKIALLTLMNSIGVLVYLLLFKR